MKISELKLREGKVEVVGEITDKGETREFIKFGRPGRVATATLKDDSGSVQLTLWNEDIDKVNVGDMVKIENGYVGEWQGEPQLTTGRLGKLEVIGKVQSVSEKQKSSKKETEKESAKAKKQKDTKEEPQDEKKDVEEENFDDIEEKFDDSVEEEF